MSRGAAHKILKDAASAQVKPPPTFTGLADREEHMGTVGALDALGDLFIQGQTGEPAVVDLF